MNDLLEKLDIAKAFVATADAAPMWQKGPAIGQAVAAVLDLLEAIIHRLEEEENHGHA